MNQWFRENYDLLGGAFLFAALVTVLLWIAPGRYGNDWFEFTYKDGGAFVINFILGVVLMRKVYKKK